VIPSSLNQSTGARRGHPIFAALYRRMIAPVEAGPVGQVRRTLLAGAHGVVVDLVPASA
jgi:hypothetical protein